MISFIVYRFRHGATALPDPYIATMLKVFLKYPLAILFTWSPYSFAAAYYYFTKDSPWKHSFEANMVLLTLGSLFGVALAVIFFTNSKEPLQRWRLLIWPDANRLQAKLQNNNESDDYSTCCVDKYYQTNDEPLLLQVQLNPRRKDSSSFFRHDSSEA